jgi:UDP-MurNAc hydroxylase
MRITYYGQACTLVEAGGLRILTDPWLTEGAYLGTWFHTHVLAEAGVTPENFPSEIDYLFLSHEHQDHTDATALKHFRPEIPILICQFPNQKFRKYLEGLGFTNIRESLPGATIDLPEGVAATIFGTAEYVNDSAILIEHNGVRALNETDCKLSYADLERIGRDGLDIGFFMFSGANWFPMVYDYPKQEMLELVRRRRRYLLRSLVERVRITRPRFAVPAAGPVSMLDPEMLWLNCQERGIFIDPELAVREIQQASVPCEPLYMVATDTWHSKTGFSRLAPTSFQLPRMQYVHEASERMAPWIAALRAAEPPAHPDLPNLLPRHFQALVAAQTPLVRRRLNAKMALSVCGSRGGEWTVDFCARGSDFVKEGISPDWTYKLELDDKLISPFVTGEEPFFEDLLLSMRFRAARRPDDYNEPLYHFLYDPDPERLHNWYATH